MPATSRLNPNREQFRRLKQLTGLSRELVYRGVRNGTLPGSFQGNKVVITAASVDLFERYSCWPPPVEPDDPR